MLQHFTGRDLFIVGVVDHKSRAEDQTPVEGIDVEKSGKICSR